MLILASASPRRRELLSRLCVPFTVEPSRVEERDPVPGEDPVSYALELAQEKAAEVALRHPTHPVLAADTVVCLDGLILGKPLNTADAVRILSELRGKTHSVTTAVCVRSGAAERSGTDTSAVTMRDFSDEEIKQYVATGEPMDKAGAYALQGLGGALVEQVAGCYETVVGLPLGLTCRLLSACGIIREDTINFRDRTDPGSSF